MKNIATVQKSSRAEVVQAIVDTIAANTQEPAESLISMGETLQKVGKMLVGMDAPSARAVMRAVCEIL